MKLENQVCSLELAKKLKELGVKQDSHWYWVKSPQSKKYSLMAITNPQGYTNLLSRGYTIISAFTVAELGEFMPEDIEIVRDDDNKNWMCLLTLRAEPEIKDKNMANALVKMLIYLFENITKRGCKHQNYLLAFNDPKDRCNYCGALKVQ